MGSWPGAKTINFAAKVYHLLYKVSIVYISSTKKQPLIRQKKNQYCIHCIHSSSISRNPYGSLTFEIRFGISFVCSFLYWPEIVAARLSRFVRKFLGGGK